MTAPATATARQPACIDLQEQFGRRYRIGWEAGGATRYQMPEADRPWLLELRCRYGSVSPHGGALLQAMTDRPRLGTKLRALPCVLSARGELETVVVFHVKDAAVVFSLLKPYRRRQISEAERARLAAQGRRFQFGGGDGLQSDDSALESTIAAPDGATVEGGDFRMNSAGRKRPVTGTDPQSVAQ